MPTVEILATRAEAHALLARVFIVRAAATVRGDADAPQLEAETEALARRLLALCDQLQP